MFEFPQVENLVSVAAFTATAIGITYLMLRESQSRPIQRRLAAVDTTSGKSMSGSYGANNKRANQIHDDTC